ncbi:MAG TPA: site-specific integrase [Proteobacteria bacterium]|nr:site-specific integrase [Pseudomonadota bacterium]
MKPLAAKRLIGAEKEVENMAKNANVKQYSKYGQNGGNYRSMNIVEWQTFLGVIDDFKHKLIMRLLYESGCRVGELVRIQLKHLDFINSSIFFPAENTKTNQSRTSHIPVDLMNDIKTCLRQERRMAKRSGKIFREEDFLVLSNDYRTPHASENRIRQIFRKYIRLAGLDREVGHDILGRRLCKFTVHSLRHTHCMHYIHIHKLPIPIVQRQVGHKTLKATMVYCQPNDEMVRQAYGEVRVSG